MKDRRFIELLNLYLDREISPVEAAELEAEVRRNEARRQLFNQYARLDRACTMVLSQGAVAPAPKLAATLAGLEHQEVALPVQAVGRSKFVLFGGLMAAAAAVAIVFVSREGMPAQASNPSPNHFPPPLAVVPPVPASTGREATVALPFGGNRPAPDLAAERQAYAWMKDMEFSRSPRLSDEDLKLVARAEKPFSSGLTWGLRESTTFPKAGVARPPTELNAFEVRK